MSNSQDTADTNKRLKRFVLENQQRIMSSTRRDNQNIEEQIDAEIAALREGGTVDQTIVQVENSFSEYREPRDDYEETPLGSGRFSRIPEDVDKIQEQIDELKQELDYYGNGLQEDEDWPDMINPEYDRLHKAITELQQKCLLEVNIEAVAEVEKLFEMLLDHRNNLSAISSQTTHSKENQPQLVPSRLEGSENGATDIGTAGNDSCDLLDQVSDLLSETIEARVQVLSTVQEAAKDVGTSMAGNKDDLLPKILQFYTKMDSAGGIEQISKQLDLFQTQISKITAIENKYTSLVRQVEDLGKAKADLEKKVGDLHVKNQNLQVEIANINKTNQSRDREISTLKSFMNNVQVSLRAITRWVKSLLPNSGTQNPGVDLSVSPILNGGVHSDHTPSASIPQVISSQSCPSSPTRRSNAVDRNTTLPVASRLRRIFRSSDELDSNASASDASVLKVHKSRLERDREELKKLITTDVSESLPDDIIVDLFTNVIDDVVRIAKECDDQCLAYAKLSDHNENLIDSVNRTTSSAQEWVSGVKGLYRSRQLHLHSTVNKAFDGSLNLQKFSASSSETIFEFFHKFDQFTRASYTSQQRAMLLYSTYLDERLKMELVPMCNSYQDMKDWLIKKFGRVKVIIDTKLDSLRSKRLPSSNASSTQRADYCRHVFSILASIQTLPISSNIPVETVAIHAYSHESLLKVLQCLPSKLVEVYMQRITKKQMDTDYFEGKDAFDILVELVKSQYRNLEATAKVTMSYGAEGRPGVKEKGKDKERRRSNSSSPLNTRVHNVAAARSPSSDSSSGSDSDSGIMHHSAHHQNTSANSPSLKKKHKSSKWYDSKFKFPCPLQKHSHELGSCDDFFKREPKSRKWVSYRKLCFCCLSPFENCREGCKNIASVPVRLVCQECLVKSDSTQKSPFNVLFCMNKEHTKLSVADLVKECEKYFKGFTAEHMKNIIPSSINLVAVTSKCKECNHKHSDCNCNSPFSYSSPSDPDTTVPSINTASGEVVDTDNSLIKLEPSEEAFYIMQTFDIRGQECLTFFDRGANQNLIDGDLAESANLKVLNPRSVPIGVVGGGRIWTEYGMYCLNIGPTPEGYYHEVKCQGIKKITERFPHYDLSDVNKLVRKSESYAPGTNLPKFIGGSRVKLLLGIKDVQLDPEKLFTLPCGLGIYQSQLMDKFKSRICFGGPHSLFSEVNERAGGNFNHLNVYLTEMVQSYRSSLYPRISSSYDLDLEDDDDLPLSYMVKRPNVHMITADREMSIPMYTTPLSLEDTQIFDPTSDGCDVSPTPLCEMLFEGKGMETKDEPITGSTSVHHCSVYKAKVPLSKLVKVIDEEDIDKLVNYRCPACSKCIKCLESNRTKTMSLQESMEQKAIADSVEIDKVEQKVWVTYPFIKEPVQFLQKFHKGRNDNYYQAHQAYKQQCRKPDRVKEGIKLAHKELVEKEFMKPLSELSPAQQALVKNHPFCHYYPWSSVVKDSISTPVRLVVDPSRTGLNLILAKGENNMARIVDVLIRNRCRKHIFTSDISKLYNQLHLKDSALPYSLFLFSDDLDPELPPQIYALVRAWYGVRSTGNQSGEALESLASMFQSEFPLARSIIEEDRYVDDILSGSNECAVREEQVQQVQDLLQRGGFKLKFVAKSGEDPPKEAAGEEDYIKILGYRWASKSDKLCPGFSEINFNRKSRGMKRPNMSKIDTAEALDLALSDNPLTRRIVISKIAEFYDPLGIWEPLKLQLKLEASLLNGMGWDEILPEELQCEWKGRLKDFLEIPLLEVSRCVIPPDAIDPNSVQLICFSDAAVAAGGAAIYARYRISESSYSCQLLTAKSKMMDMSIPRNELSAILLMTELGFLVKKALGTMVSEVLYFTDSTIAMSWCHNVNKKLRMFVFNRVATVRRFIDWTTGESTDIPLFHIPGPENIADLLTKEHNLSPTMLSMESEWMQGKAWMTRELQDMPVLKYSDLTVSASEAQEVNTECFPELSQQESQNLVAFSNFSPNQTESIKSGSYEENLLASSVLLARKGPPMLQPLIPIVSKGWRKSVHQMTILVKFASWLIHKTHSSSKNHEIKSSLRNKCKVCSYVHRVSQSSGTPLTRNKENKSVCEFFLRDNRFLGENYWFQFSGHELRALLPSKKLSEFNFSDGIYYYTGRLSRDFPVVSSDLDIQVFFDNQDFQAVLPVLHSSSPIFFAYIIYVHDTLRPHSGVELTYREVTKKMYVLDNPKAVIIKVRKDCTKCKMLLRKTLELEMANHGPHRTIMSPPFHAIQMDIVYKFRAKPWVNSRQSFDIYALVIVCILTSATSILALEGLETTNVVQALERHSSRYGVPRYVFVDSGSQLVALQHSKFSIRDLDLTAYSNLGLSVRVSNPKSHEERGRVEAKVKVLRSMLCKMAVDCNQAMTIISWETLFSKIANDIDNLPICRGSVSSAQDFGFDIITPNRLKLGRNNHRSLDDGFILDGNTEVELLERNRKLQTVWYQVLLDRLHHLIPKCKKWSKTDTVVIGDIVVFVHTDSGIEKRWSWFLGKVVGISGRSLNIQYFGPGKKKKLYVSRNPRQVSKIHSAGDLPVNTLDYYLKNIVKK